MGVNQNVPELTLMLKEPDKLLTFHKDTVTVGRHPNCDISLFGLAGFESVSRWHAEFVYLNDHWFVRDRDSKNGTCINGKRIPARIPSFLRPGDAVTFAQKLTILFQPESSKPDPAYLQALQNAMNRIYPGLTMFVRDVNLPAHIADRYQPGMILREKGFVDASVRVMGMVTTHRFAILSNHMANLSQYEHGTNWGLHVASNDSRFKVLGTHTYCGKTAIFLLHLPGDDSWTLFQNTEIDLDKQLLADCIQRFESKCLLPPVPELATAQWLDRCRFPVGMDDSGNPFPLE